jgi:lipid-A-disaccharide synthase
MRILISTGEVSGDIAGSHAAREILQRVPDARLYGIGGARLAQAGVDLEYSTIHLGTVGVSESLAAVPGLFQAIRRIRRRVAAERPDVALLIGNDLFNVILGRWLRRQGIRTISWFPPQVWIWRSLAWLFTRSFDEVLASFPDEQRVYSRHRARTTFVGHYLADQLTPVTNAERSAARTRLDLDPAATLIAVLPGSRRQELRSLADPFLDAVSMLRARPELHYILPVSDAEFADDIRAKIASRHLEDRVRIIDGQSHDVMRASDLILTASGTATLEATLLGVPMVVAYRVSRFTLFIVRLAIRAGLMDAETTALPNLILGRTAVTELKQQDVTAARIAAEMERLLEDAIARRKMIRDLGEAAHSLRGTGAIAHVVDCVIENRGLSPATVRWERSS